MNFLKAEQLSAAKWRVLSIPFGGPFDGKDLDEEFFRRAHRHQGSLVRPAPAAIAFLTVAEFGLLGGAAAAAIASAVTVAFLMLVSSVFCAEFSREAIDEAFLTAAVTAAEPLDGAGAGFLPAFCPRASAMDFWLASALAGACRSMSALARSACIARRWSSASPCTSVSSGFAWIWLMPDSTARSESASRPSCGCPRAAR